MEADLQAQVAFYLTGRKPAEGLDAIEGLALRPALLAPYRDLTSLRYDFPVVLLEGSAGAFVESLTALVDRALDQLAAGGDGSDRLKQHAWRLEREIRLLLSEGAKGTLSSLWGQAATRLASRGGESLADSLSRVRAATKAEGQVLDCEDAMPAALFGHAWGRIQAAKAARLRDDCSRLVLKLMDILNADLAHSEAGLSPQSLKASIGAPQAEAFDFHAMSSILARTSRRSLSNKRRERIRTLIAALKNQRFSPGSGEKNGAPEPYSFVFHSCAGALKAFSERLPETVKLARALAIAELESKGEYSEARHDALFEAFGQSGLQPEDMSPFPDYLVCLDAGRMDAAEDARVMEIFSSGLPMKVLLQTDDLLETPALGGRLAVGLRSARLASMALGLNQVYVLQSSASHLLQCRDRVERGLSYAGPALFSVYSGGTASSGEIPPYLNAAAAMESRVFPAYTYDPSAGADWASRLQVTENPQAGSAWPLQSVSYEDEEHQRHSEEVPFTLIDFVACDRRFARHFARVPRAKWNGTLITVRDCLEREPGGLPDKVPYLPMVDRDNLLQKVIVDEQLIREVRRRADAWRSLQELGGIRNSHAERMLALEKSAWEEKQRATGADKTESKAPAQAVAAVAPAPAATPAAAQAEPQPVADEPYIETPRCTTCEECVQINNKLFAYDGNKQAYIKDLAAGTYRQLVEAAESCQVSIIHPGKPRDSGELGLDELLKRAEPFL